MSQVRDASSANDNDDEQPIVQNELGSVCACDCGGVRLSIGLMTLHLEDHDVDCLFELMGGVKEVLDHQIGAPAVLGHGRSKSKLPTTFH